MDAFVDTLIQLLIDWGYAGLFISALLAGSIVPFSSELVMIALVKVGLSPAICVLAATLGNTAGGMTCYYMGCLGKTDWIEEGENRQDAAFSARERSAYGFLCFPAFRRRGHCHSIGIYAQQRHSDCLLHVCGETDTVHRHATGIARGVVDD